MTEKSSGDTIGIVILAAGGSRRMNGEPKQLLKFRGISLLKRAVETALASKCRPVVVVLGANAGKSKEEIERDRVITVLNEKWEEGLGSSIKTGLSAMLDIEPEVEAVILMLCDQPLITSNIIDQLAEAYHKTGKAIVASEYENTVGVPALFSKEVFDKLRNIDSHSGAKSLIENEPGMVESVFVPQAATDIDSPQDHERLVKEFDKFI
jgi:molybdenum cofactor cytidylyltransferase